MFKQSAVPLVFVAAALAASPSIELAGPQNPPGAPPTAAVNDVRSPTPRAAVYAQFCAGCHGPNLQGGSATSLADDEWKHGGDDASVAKVISEGVAGTTMAPFKTVLGEAQIRELVFFIREQASASKGRPETNVDPDGQVVRSERQTVKLEVVARGLDTPWGLAFLPDGRLLITERPGRLRVVEKDRLLPPVAGVPQVWAVQDGGMLDVEVHPDYGRTGWIYLAFSEAGPEGSSMTRIVRGKIRDNAWVDQHDIFKASPELFYVGNIHYGTRFIFDREGHLFYSIGDRGHPQDAQDLSKPTGKIHRVNDDGSVPRDNPFFERAGALGSIWSYGHRHNQGFGFDPQTGKLWASEHGPTGGDELNVIERGENYGWPIVSFGLEPGISKAHGEGLRPPAAYWNPSIAPAGMAFCSGTRYSGWRNHLLLGALGGQQLRRVEVAGDAVLNQEVAFDRFGRVRDVVMGPDGFLYVVLNIPGQRLSDSTSGFVVRLVPQE